MSNIIDFSEFVLFVQWMLQIQSLIRVNEWLVMQILKVFLERVEKHGRKGGHGQDNRY